MTTATENNKLISDYVTETITLCNDFIEFHNKFSKTINDLKIKSVKILELLSNNSNKANGETSIENAQDNNDFVNITTNVNSNASEIISVINYVNDLSNLSQRSLSIIKNIESENKQDLDKKDDDDEAREKIEKLMEIDNFNDMLVDQSADVNFEAQAELVSTVTTSNEVVNDDFNVKTNKDDDDLFNRYRETHNLKQCNVVLSKLTTAVDKVVDTDLTKESENIDRLCNIDQFIENIKNKTGKKSKLKKTDKKQTVSKKKVEKSKKSDLDSLDDYSIGDESNGGIVDHENSQSIVENELGDTTLKAVEESNNENVDLDDEIARVNIEDMMKENGFVESSMNIANDVSSSEDDEGAEKSCKKTAAKKHESSKKQPLLSPLRLNLLRTPTPDNENTLLDHEQEHEQEVAEEPLTILDIIKETEISKIHEQDSEEEESIKKVGKTLGSKLKLLESDESRDTNMSSKNGEEEDKVTKMTRSRAKLIKNKKEVINLDDTDSDFEEISKKATNSARKRKISNMAKLKDKLNDEDDDDDESIGENVDKKIKVEDTDDEMEDEEEGDNKKKSKKSKKESLGSRRKIRQILDDSKLKLDTQIAIEAEEERLKRVKEKEKQMELQILPIEDGDEQSGEEELTITHVEAAKGLFLDIDEKSQKPLIEVDRKIVRHLKKHQIDGIKFMWNSCYESVEAVKKSKYSGGGCVLAHCMGLGKTLQVIALTHTLITHSELTETNRVLVLTPINALLNWRQEYTHWLKNCIKKIHVYDIANVKTIKERSNILEKWFDDGGVLIMGYTMFTNLVRGKAIKKKPIRDDIEKFLADPGADLVVCDEGHVLKNEKTGITKCVSRVRTKRRIVLTGSPLQNNLNEYHCMVSFVKPNLLGTSKEFRNRFVNPIYNGQHADSTEADVKFMKKRAHVLHKTLIGCVQRMDYTVIKPFLPPKTEYVISIRLSEVQQLLYKMYLEREGLDKVSKIGKIKGVQLFSDFQHLYRIWTHPWVLKMFSIQKQTSEARKQANDFINDEDEFSSFCEEVDNLSDILDDGSDNERKSSKKSKNSENAAKLKEFDLKIKNELFDDDIIVENNQGGGENENNDNNEAGTSATYTTSRRTRSKKNEVDNEKSPATSIDDPEKLALNSWWSGIVTDDMEFDINLSGKIFLFYEILKRCEQIGDKLLVFSHSLFSLDLIEKFLSDWTLKKQGQWLPLVDYYRIDGSTEVSSRKRFINDFNDESSNVRLFLISTKAGGIGINLVGANRVIVFDASWNPVHDLQSVFRVYRFGQKKPVYIYRFLSQGTMEEKIYQRQVTKQSLSLRVIDEHQLDRHFTSTELRELYKYEPDIIDESQPRPIPKFPSDKLLADLLKTCDKWISKHIDHDSLLENKLEEGLSEQEQKVAWDEYEAEKQGLNNNLRYQQQPQQQQQQQQQQDFLLQHRNLLQTLQQHSIWPQQQFTQEQIYAQQYLAMINQNMNNLPKPNDFILNNEQPDIGNQRQKQTTQPLQQQFRPQNYSLLNNNNNNNNNNQRPTILSGLRNILQDHGRRANNFNNNNLLNPLAQNFIKDLNRNLSNRNSPTPTTPTSNDQPQVLN